MSFATNLMFLNMATMAKSNANFGMQRANQTTMNLINCSDGDKLDFNSIHQKEQKLTFTSLTDGLRAKMAAAMEENLQEQLKKDIKKEFSTFA